MAAEGPFLVRAGDAGEQPSGVVVPAELAGLVDRLLAYGLDVLAARNGGLPDVPGLDGLRAQLRVSSVSASGRRPRILALPEQSSGHYMTVPEAAALMGVSPRQVRRLAEAGVVIARKRGRDWQVDADSAAQYEIRRQAWHQEQQAA